MANIREKAIVDIDINGQQAAKRIEELTQKSEEYRKKLIELKDANDLKGFQEVNREYNSTQKELKGLINQTNKYSKTLNNLSGASYKELKKAQREIIKELSGMTRGTDEYIDKSKQLQDVTKELERAKGEMFGTQSILGKITSGFKKFLPIVGVGAFVGLVKSFADINKELEESRRKVEDIGAATEKESYKIAGQVQAISDVYDKSFDDVLISANAFGKQLGIDVGESLEKIKIGFAAGADASGEFLDILKEYGNTFKEAGISADEAIGIITQQVQEGIYSDKGIDAIKEANLRLREMPQATQDALNAIGISSAELQKGLEDGSITTFQAIQKVSSKLDELPPQSNEVGTAIADIFGGPGEDAGLKFLTTLKDVNVDLEEMKNNLTDLQRNQLELNEATERYDVALQNTFKNTSGFIGEVKIAWKSFTAGVVEDIGLISNALTDKSKTFGEKLASFSAIGVVNLRLEKTIGDEVNKVKERLIDLQLKANDGNEQAQISLNKYLEQYKQLGSASYNQIKQQISLEAELEEKRKARVSAATGKETGGVSSKSEQNKISEREKALQAIERLENEFALKQLARDEQEIERIKQKYVKIIENEALNENERQQLKELMAQEILAKEQEQKIIADEKAKEDFEISLEKMREELTIAYEEEKLILQEQYADRIISKEEHDAQAEALELAHLETLKAFNESYGQSSAKQTEAILKKKINAINTEKKASDDLMKARQKETEAFIKSAGQQAAAEASKASNAQDAARAILSSVTNSIKSYISEGVMGSVAKTVAEIPFPASIITGAIAYAAVNASLNALMNKIIPKFASGQYSVPFKGEAKTGYTDGPTIYQAGEDGIEFIVSNPDLSNPRIAQSVRAIQYEKGIIPAFADGNYSTSTSENENTNQEESYISSLIIAVNNLNNILSSGIRATIIYDDIREAEEEISNIENNLNLNG